MALRSAEVPATSEVHLRPIACGAELASGVACDEDVIPDPARLAAVGDSADLEAIHDTERHLLYVAFTRACDRLLVSGLKPGRNSSTMSGDELRKK